MPEQAVSVPEDWSEAACRDAIEPLAGVRGALLPVLHAVQHRFGFIEPRAVPVIADVLNLSRAEVHGVVTYYRDFRTKPPCRGAVRICRGEACQAVGAERLVADAEHVLGVALGAESADESVSLDDVFCLGNCALGPSVTVDGRLYGRVDPERLVTLLDSGAAGPDDGGEEEPRASGVVVYVPRDTAARAVGADAVAARIVEDTRAAGVDVRIVRNGSRGALWLEPLVEVATEAGRVAYGPVAPHDVPGLLAAGFLEGGDHPLGLGPTEAVPWLARQDRVTFARVGVVDPRSADDYEAAGGLAGLRRALAMAPAEVIGAVTESGLRGRGGAGFPAGIKWTTVAEAPVGERFICCNADEGDSGTFADRMLLEGDPFLLIEGMTIAAHAVDAAEGFVYVRSEYPDAIAALDAAITTARGRGWLGDRVLGSELSFDLEVRVGAGSYVCGEETAMLESLEGRRGVVRSKPPLPALEGLFGRPTVVNNVLTLAAVPAILADGPAAYASRGAGRSRGTQVFQLGGDVARGGIVELPFGVPLDTLVADFGGGTRSGRPVRAVQVGGPLGAYLPASNLDVPMDYESLTARDGLLGHGGVVVFDDSVDLARQARFAMEFCAEESCGKCTPCRIGAVRGVEVIDRIIADEDRDANLELLEDLCEVMVDGSLCAMGGLTPLPVRSALRHFPGDFRRPGATVEPGRAVRERERT